jgi:hypothetical protein
MTNPTSRVLFTDLPLSKQWEQLQRITAAIQQSENLVFITDRDGARVGNLACALWHWH